MKKRSKHVNNGKCEKCEAIMGSLGSIHQKLRGWFVDFQSRVPSAHISCANRGKKAQNDLFYRGRSRALWKESAHNWGCALDLFEMSGDLTRIYEPSWFGKHLSPEIAINPLLKWYGQPGFSFFELPHVELNPWKLWATQGIIKPVE